MTSYTNTFTGAPIQVTPTSFRAFSIGSDTTLSWPQSNDDNSNVTADTMEVTAVSSSLSLIMPPADQVSNGKACLIRNVGSNTFIAKDSSGGTIQSISPGQVFWVYVKENSTAAGTWSSFQFGTGTSSANAADLDGNGLTAIGSLLNVAFPVNSFNSNFTLSTNYRATIANWTGGAGTFSFSASATLGNNWFIILKNSGSGALVLDPNGGELIDGVATVTLNAGESCIVVCTGTALLSFCKNSVSAITFTRLVKSVAGSSNVTLTSAEAGYDIQEYTGLLTGNISVIVPTAASRWWVYNNTTGAFSLTVKTAAGTGIVVQQGTRQILHCDGTNVVKSVDSGSGTVTNIATGTGLSGGPITAIGTISIANTSVTPSTYGGSMGVSSITVNAQGQLTSASFTARSITGTSNRISVTNGDGASGAPTIDISSNYAGQSSITTLGTISTGVWNGTAIAVSNGGTGATSLAANNVILGNGTSAVQVVAPSTSGNVLTSNGTTWTSGALPSATTTALGAVELATNAEVATGTDTSRAVTPSTIGSHLSTLKAWAVFTIVGTTTTIVNSYNVSAVISGVNRLVQFTNAMPNTNYGVLWIRDTSTTGGGTMSLLAVTNANKSTSEVTAAGSVDGLYTIMIFGNG